ncbi:uncharacterized protein LOC119103447 [Pollicipes pollicipes]|uniref:uncharacterized protein LOC119103447 n=1 Tax=Pollicipes pollicipes TaxID=41117 RepID=UPI00188507ED|nr:uncharacterized protein LOC119103447 [Pollicipes pollicipes]
MGRLVLLGLLAALALSARAATNCPPHLSDLTVCEGAAKKGQCPAGYMYQEKLLGCSLCSGCVAYKGFSATCLPASTTPEQSQYSIVMKSGLALVNYTDCGPGLNCTDGRCQLADSTTPCLQALHDYLTASPPKTYWYRPECLPDGTYAPVQCQDRTTSGVCFCVTSDGTRIFGRDLHTNRHLMTCACSRKFWEMTAADRKDITLHCEPNGNYEPLQCDKDVCFCVNSTTAELYGGTVSREQWTGLPCYDPKHFPGSYNRLCESMNRASRKVATLLVSHGIHESSNFSAKCDPDGSYYPTYCSAKDQSCKCRDRAGNNIGNYYVDSSHADANSMNCQCARDHNDYDAIAYSLRNVACDTNGNYKPEQCGQDQCYCVDSWGTPSSLPVTTNIDGVGALTRCCLKCLRKNTLDCSDKTKYEKYCTEGLPTWLQ